MIPFIATGLSLLPQLPSLWKGVASLFKKEVPSTIEGAISLAKDVKDIYETGKISPEQKIELERLMLSYEQEMAKIALEEKKLFHEELEGVRKLEIASYSSGDPYVAHTRPKLLRDWSKYSVIFAFYAPLVVLAAHALGTDADLCIDLVKWIGSFVFGTFATAFVGYTTARTIDKRNPAIKTSDNVIGNIVKNIIK